MCFKNNDILKIYFGSAGCSLLHQLSLVVAGRALLPVGAFGLLLLQSMGRRAGGYRRLWLVGSAFAAPGLQSTGSTVVAPLAESIFGYVAALGLRTGTLRVLQADSLPVSQQGSSHFMHSRMHAFFKTICKES